MKRMMRRFGSSGLWFDLGSGLEGAWLRYVLVILPKWGFGEEPLLVGLPGGTEYRWKS